MYQGIIKPLKNRHFFDKGRVGEEYRKLESPFYHFFMTNIE